MLQNEPYPGESQFEYEARIRRQDLEARAAVTDIPEYREQDIAPPEPFGGFTPTDPRLSAGPGGFSTRTEPWLSDIQAAREYGMPVQGGDLLSVEGDAGQQPRNYRIFDASDEMLEDELTARRKAYGKIGALGTQETVAPRPEQLGMDISAAAPTAGPQDVVSPEYAQAMETAGLESEMGGQRYAQQGWREPVSTEKLGRPQEQVAELPAALRGPRESTERMPVALQMRDEAEEQRKVEWGQYVRGEGARPVTPGPYSEDKRRAQAILQRVDEKLDQQIAGKRVSTLPAALSKGAETRAPELHGKPPEKAEMLNALAEELYRIGQQNG